MAPISCALSWVLVTALGSCASAATGCGMLGMGGAKGPANAANAGKKGSAGIFSVARYCVHAFENTLASLVTCGPWWLGIAAIIRGVHGTPTKAPPEAVTAATVAPDIVVAF